MNIKIPFETKMLLGNLDVPAHAVGLVLFAHGSGSSRLSPRNQFVAHYLQTQNIGTLLFDLLTEEEERTQDLRFEIPLLSARLIAAIKWAKKKNDLPIGLFGASTGAAAALAAAAEMGTSIRAVVSRGGRPDLAGPCLEKVLAPTLLIVGGLDSIVIELNQSAYAQLRCEKKLEIVPRATHLFEEPGTLEQVAKLAAHWFLSHLPLATFSDSL
jgi:putative phosphoribosyl transferase